MAPKLRHNCLVGLTPSHCSSFAEGGVARVSSYCTIHQPLVAFLDGRGICSRVAVRLQYTRRLRPSTRHHEAHHKSPLSEEFLRRDLPTSVPRVSGIDRGYWMRRIRGTRWSCGHGVHGDTVPPSQYLRRAFQRRFAIVSLFEPSPSRTDGCPDHHQSVTCDSISPANMTKLILTSCAFLLLAVSWAVAAPLGEGE